MAAFCNRTGQSPRWRLSRTGLLAHDGVAGMDPYLCMTIEDIEMAGYRGGNRFTGHQTQARSIKGLVDVCRFAHKQKNIDGLNGFCCIPCTVDRIPEDRRSDPTSLLISLLGIPIIWLWRGK
jgi:hypothetical protein